MSRGGVWSPQLGSNFDSQGGVSGCYGSTPTTLVPVRQVAPCPVDTHRRYKPVCAYAGQFEPPPTSSALRRPSASEGGESAEVKISCILTPSVTYVALRLITEGGAHCLELSSLGTIKGEKSK